MEGSPDDSYRFWDALPRALIVSLPVIVGSAAIIVGGMISQEQQADQAERVVELLQETPGPASVIADQQAEAARHHDAADWGWYRLVGSLAVDTVAIGAVTGGYVWWRRRREQDQHEG